jgi:hypothetical protein
MFYPDDKISVIIQPNDNINVITQQDDNTKCKGERYRTARINIHIIVPYHGGGRIK